MHSRPPRRLELPQEPEVVPYLRGGTTNLIALGLGGLTGLLHIPFPAAWMLFLPLGLLFMLILEQTSPKASARVAFFGGLGFWAMHLFWLPESFATLFGIYGGRLGALTVWALMPLVWVAEAGFWWLTTWVAARLTYGYWARMGTLASGFLLLEWLRELGPLAFPWGNFGYALIDTPLSQAASIGGVYFESALMIGLAMGIAALGRNQWRPLAYGAAIWVVMLGFGLTVSESPVVANSPVLLVQRNLNPFEKAKFGVKSELSIYQKLSQAAPPGALVVWPEAAVNLEDAIHSGLVNPLVAGAYEINSTTTNKNGVEQTTYSQKNVVAFVRGGKLEDKSSKAKLVPFGEFSPWRRELSLVYEVVYRALGLGSPGGAEVESKVKPLLMPGRTLGVFVCYDSIFPGVVSKFVEEGAQVLIMPTNDAWFGGKTGNLQHLTIDRMRAIEQNRYILRAANTGITAVIDPKGRVVARLPQNKQATLEAMYAPLDQRTNYSEMGDWVVLVATVMGLLLALWGRQNTRR